MSWDVVRLGEVISHRKGFITIDDEKPYKLCRVQLHRRGVLLREIIKGNQIKTKKQQICKGGDFLVAEMDAKVGGYGFIPAELDGAIVSSHYYLFELNTAKINPKYLEVLSKLPIIQDQIKATGSTNYAAIRPQNVLDWEIPLPHIQTQEKIADLYLKTSTGCDYLKSNYLLQFDLLRKIRQQILQDAVQGKLVQQDPNDEPASVLLERIKAEKEKLVREKKIKREKPLPPIKQEDLPFEIPENWVWCRFSSIATIESNLVDPFEYPNHPHIAPDNIEKGTGRLLDYKTVKEDNVISSNHYFFPSQLIYSKVRPRLNKVVKVDFEGLCSADMYPIKSLINPDYLLNCILSKYFLDEVFKFDNRVKMPKINQNQLSQILIPVPPIQEQKRIKVKIEKLKTICNELEQTIKQNEKYTQELLQVALKEALKPKNI